MSSVPQFPPPRPLPPAVPSTVTFSGDRGEFRRLVTRGAGLELVTVGFYRFWLATDIRRHLWSYTSVDGDAAEYTGRGRELLVGFLFALAILVPIYLAYFIVGLEVERFRAFASVPLLLFFYLFGQFAIYRARRYRLTRTVWRGVRFWMSGSGWAYAVRAALWALLMLPTLGLILPWREAALERYKMRNCYYGDLQGRFEGSGWDLFKRGWWLWLMAFVPIIILTAMLPSSNFAPGLLPRVGAVVVVLLWLVSTPFIYGAFKAVEWRWWISGLRFGDVYFESDLRRGGLVGLYWKVIGWFLLIAFLFTTYLSFCASLIAGINRTSMVESIVAGNLQGSIPMMVLAGLGYLAFILAVNVVLRVYLQRDLWARVVSSTTAYNIEAASNVSARGDLANALGEGLAGGLDVVGF
jgi:uncharacterized membrane protein YjgN (DUF898 family)